MVIGRIRFLASTIAPKPEEIEYWIDLSEDRYGCVIKCYNGVEWERIDQRTYDEIISFKHKLDELLIEIQECENDLLQHKEDFEEYKNETDSSLNAINEQIEDINASLETLLGESASEFIDKYNEILNFLTGYEDTDTLQSILSDLKNEISQNITEIESNLTSHINNKNNPHNVTKQQIGLSNVDNTSDLNKPISTATQNALNTVKQEITNDLNTHKQNTQNPHNITKQQVGLSNVTNDAQVKRSEMGTANGIATLNEQGLIPSNQLPSYVDDVIDCYATYSKEEDGTLSNIKLYSDAEHQNAITGESGKIYVDITGSDSAYQFRWTGTQFTVVGAPTVIGEITGTAFDGAKGKALEDKLTQHIGDLENPHEITIGQIGGIGSVKINGSGNAITSAVKNSTELVLNKEQYFLSSSEYTANDILTKLKTVDGINSELDADLLDGKHYQDIIDGNVASASKLQEIHTFWGQNFDGTQNVDGKIIVNTDEYPNIQLNSTSNESSIYYTNYYNNENNNTWAAGLGCWDAKGFCIGKIDDNYKFIITDDGNVGIGKIDPYYKLDVNGGIRAAGSLIVSAGDAILKYTAYEPKQDVLSFDRNTYNNDSLLFQIPGTHVEDRKMYLTSSRGLILNFGAVYAPSGFYEESDINLKTNIKPIDFTNNIELVSFNWKKDGKQSYGVIAQQVEQYYPELVSTDESTGYKSVNYDAVLIIKCAQLENRIKQLEKELEDLKNE